MVKSDFEKILLEYDYKLPESFIAQNPVHPRDSAKLLVYDRKSKNISVDTFKNLGNYLSPNSVLVFNNTKVIPARVIGQKPTGGKVDLLFIRKEGEKLIFWANKKLEKGLIITAGEYFFKVILKQDKEYSLKPSFPVNSYLRVFEEIGITPLPPYIKHTTIKGKKLREEYQTVFAKNEGSVAAPTASLHFTRHLMKKLQKQGHLICFITLHVNLGTFAPLREEQYKLQKLHEEFYEIDTATAKLLNNARKEGRSIVAIGTTVVRALESSSDSHGIVQKLSGKTNLFITAKTKLKCTDQVITNFHVPKSSLLMLVAAFTGRKQLLRLYKVAQEKTFRFFSFGDGMFIR
ncbi:MAG TPA: tRNA preQ1(34) S-adenosylmethionine ribosyltransferase-isomerase QueA [Candidatus Levybacteria bacterium]|nr:tRNA preQ1(34) S-adenosylmethionine ribosyltransferase-isomerase QueA [Candidatus Levybacteria bacterium]